MNFFKDKNLPVYHCHIFTQLDQSSLLRPFSTTIGWNLLQYYPVIYSSTRLSSGLHGRLSVSSGNPQELSSGTPLTCITLRNNSGFLLDKNFRCLFQSKNPQVLYIMFGAKAAGTCKNIKIFFKTCKASSLSFHCKIWFILIFKHINDCVYISFVESNLTFTVFLKE